MAIVVHGPRVLVHPWGQGWASLLLTALARAYLAFACTLSLAALVPALGPWQSFVVLSGSMRPSIDPGDVVVAAPAEQGASVPVGRVVVFRDAADSERLIVHRIINQRPDGRFTSAGDANDRWDSDAVASSQLVAHARLLVPFVGLPSLWASTGSWLSLVGWAMATMLAVVLVSRRRARAPAATEHARSWSLPSWPTTVLLIAAVLVVAFGLAGVGSAAAAFSARARDAGNSWTQTTRILQPYSRAVLADAPWVWWPLDEAGGSVARDLSGGSGRNGAYAGTVAYRQTSGLPSNAGYAVMMSGGGARVVGAGTSTTGPTTYSVELWFKTTTTSGGRLIGFANAQTATSSKADRHLFMRNDGRLTFGGWSGTNQRLLTTTAAYNNGAWHHVVVTAKPSGSYAATIVYVDGVSVANGTSTAPASYSGWWRVGYGTLPTGGSYPTSPDFEGVVDNPAVYLAELTATRVSAHYAAR